MELDSGEFIIIASLSMQTDTQVISIDSTTGALHYRGRHGLDVFPSERDAIHYLSTSKCMLKNSIFAKGIIGYAALGSVALLLLATRLRVSIPELPCGDAVYIVTESQWIKIPLRNPHFQSKREAKNAADLTDIQIDGMHYFSETRDLTRPFPSKDSIEHPDKEFVWNQWLSTPFKAVGLHQHCVTLLQVCPQAVLDKLHLHTLLISWYALLLLSSYNFRGGWSGCLYSKVNQKSWFLWSYCLKRRTTGSLCLGCFQTTVTNNILRDIEVLMNFITGDGALVLDSGGGPICIGAVW